MKRTDTTLAGDVDTKTSGAPPAEWQREVTDPATAVQFDLWALTREALAPLISGISALSVLAIAYKAGSDRESIRSDLRTNDKETAAHSARIGILENRVETQGRDHSALQAAVASLPTRTEMQAGFDSVRTDIRELTKASRD